MVMNVFVFSSHFFYFLGYAPQAEEHACTARHIMMSGVQLSSSPTDKHRILEVLISLHYTLGRAQAQQKKYPFTLFKKTNRI